MPLYNQTPLRSGDVLLADRINEIEAELGRLANIRGGAGVEVRRDKYGVQITGIQSDNRWLCKADGAISPRSGTAAGTGTVKVCHIAPDGTIAETGTSLDVFNPSESEMTSGAGIDDGLYCWAEQDPFGTWLVAPLECPPP